MTPEAEWMAMARILVEKWIQADLDRPNPMAERIIEAMRYSVLAGGKRLRPLLVLAAGDYLRVPLESLRLPALALEYIHTYSLIHDDLPAMDNDDLRRGKPTNHKVFGEALAILAGDGLLNEAFLKLSELGVDSEFSSGNVLRALRGLARASGAEGLIAGQTLDLASEHQELSLAGLQTVHGRKTGALFQAACQMPAWLTGNTDAADRLHRFGWHFGLAFQIVDDILNVVGDAAIMGKSTGTDSNLSKATYPRLVGVEASWMMARGHVQSAEEALGPDLDNAQRLLSLLRQAVNRVA